ncbi:MAG: thioredoxin family protein [Erysipelotrichaceae bacterium]|nr:thioredoxin family protein [Erysipelotrichaceae bacterium]
MMKKRWISSFILVFLLTACSSFTNKEYMQHTSVKEVFQKIQREDNSFLLLLTTNKCYSCEEYMKVIDTIQKETPFPIYYINVDQEDEDKLEELKIMIGHYNELPMTYYFNKGEVSQENIKVGYVEPEVLKEWLRKLQVIE